MTDQSPSRSGGRAARRAARAAALPDHMRPIRAGLEGGTIPAVYNAANEVAVEAFRNGQIPFPGIWQCVEAVMEGHANTGSPSLEAILDADQQARTAAAEFCQGS